MRRWSFLVLAGWLAFVMAGCGGSGGGSTSLQPQQPVVTLRTVVGTTPTNAGLVAFQDGDGPWITITPDGPGAYSGRVTDAKGRYGFAIAAPDGLTQPAITIYQGTLREMRDFTHAFCPFNTGTITLGGEIQGAVPGVNLATVALGANTSTPAVLVPYQMAFLAGGTYDLLACRRTLSPSLIDKFFVKRNVHLTGNAIQNVDFAGPLAVSPTYHSVNAPQMTTGSVTLLTANHTTLVVSEALSADSDPLTYAALPGFTSDLYIANCMAFQQSGVLQTRQIRKLAFQGPADKHATLPLLFGSPVVTGGADGNIAARWGAYPHALAYNMQLAPTSGNQWSVWVSAGWLGEQPIHHYTLPSLSTLPGWMAVWSSAGGEQMWTADAITGNRPLAETAAALSAGYYVDGMEIGVSGMGIVKP